MYLPPATNLQASVVPNVVLPTTTQAAYQISIPPDNVKRLLKRIPIVGPAGSICYIYIETIFIDVTFRGDINSWYDDSGVPVAAGQTVFLKWNVSTGSPIPSASAFFELEPQVANADLEYNMQGY